MARVLLVSADSLWGSEFRQRLELDGHWILVLPSLDTLEQRALSHRPDMVVIDGTDEDAAAVANTLRRLPFADGMPVLPAGGRAPSASPAERARWMDRIAEVIRTAHENPLARRARRFLKVGPLELDRQNRSVRLGISMVSHVPRRSFDLLWLLAKRSTTPRPICARRLILSKLWKKRGVRDRQVDVTVSRLRVLVPFLENYIQTVSSGGYRLIPPNPSSRPASPSRRLSRD